MEIDIQGARLLDRFEKSGFTGLVDEEPVRLSEYLKARAEETEQVSLAGVAKAVCEVYTFFLKHDDAGGVRTGFVAELDRLVFYFLPSIRRSDERESRRIAQEFLDLVQKRILEYDPTKSYG